MGADFDFEIVYENNLDMQKFARMFNNTSQSYKFYWFEAILNLTKETDEDLSFEKTPVFFFMNARCLSLYESKDAMTFKKASPYLSYFTSPTPLTPSISSLECGAFAHISCSVLSEKTMYGGTWAFRASWERQILSNSNSRLSPLSVCTTGVCTCFSLTIFIISGPSVGSSSS